MKKLVAFLFGFSFLLCTVFAFAIDVHFQWGPSTGVVDGYRIYYGSSSEGPYSEQLCEVNGTTLNYVASLNEEREYFLICRAFNVYGESGDSIEIHWRYYAVPGTPPTFHWGVDLVEILKSLGADQIRFVSKE